MIRKRSSGILAHITSLPSPFGIGDIGPASRRFIDFLGDCDQSYWQFLPTGPTNTLFDNSPYMSTSAFAGSPLLISPELLHEEGLVSRTALDDHPSFSPYLTDFTQVRLHKEALLREAYQGFRADAEPEYDEFLATSPWLDDYALFMTLKELYHDTGWFAWPRAVATRTPETLKKLLVDHLERVNFYRFEQFLFFRQWRLLRRYAAERGIQLLGDLPIYVSYDSVDVWAHQNIFALNRRTLRPTKVSGVPPDYFSKTGQRWGNPLYDWHSRDPKTQEALIAWWAARLAHLFGQVDVTRIDHFRGFHSYWAIPEEKETAIEGKWLKGPGAEFFKKIAAKLGSLNIVAEDLGIIPEEVEALRLELGFPGMKVLQFAFDGNPKNSFLPHNFQSSQFIVYTGTHDNDTTVGWYLSDKLDDQQRATVKMMANRSPGDHQGVHHDLIYLAQASIAMLCVFPLQDILGFGNDCKMNSPGVPTGNWQWRCAQEFLTTEVADRLRSTTRLFGRGRNRP